MKVFLALIGFTALTATAQEGLPDKTIAELVKKDLTANVQMTYELLKENNKFKSSDVTDMAKQFGWEVAGSLDGRLLKLNKVKVSVGQTSSVGGVTVTSDYNADKKTLNDWAKNFGTTAMGFMPKVGTAGNLPGFIMLLTTIAGTIDRHYGAERLARKAQEQTCFDKKGRTYKDLCDNCNPDLLVSVLGKLHNCTDVEVAPRNYNLEHRQAKSFCTTVLCTTYGQTGTLGIINQVYRYDPLRSFWCKEKEPQIALALDPAIGEAIRTHLDVIDFEEFRKALQGPCIKLLDNGSKNRCPSKAAIEAANKAFPPITYCQPGKKPAPNNNNNDD